MNPIIALDPFRNIYQAGLAAGDVNAELVRANGPDQIADTANVVVNNNGALDLSLFTETIATLSGDGAVTRSRVRTQTFNTDLSTEVSPNKTYTHLLDFAAGGKALAELRKPKIRAPSTIVPGIPEGLDDGRR